MLHVGLTGNVASGKSSVARHFASWGAVVIDSDQIVREVQRPGSPTLDRIVETFGDDILCRDGTLNRAALRARVMHDGQALAALNAIVHPVVGARRAALLAHAKAEGAEIVVSDVPLLFEVLDPGEFDVIVLVDAPAELRRRRLTDQRGMELQEADRLLESQLDPTLKRQRSDLVIENDGTLADLQLRSWEAWHALQTLAHRAQSESGDEGVSDRS